jgi:hypothetical protein
LAVKAAFKNKQVPKLASGAMDYMMSKTASDGRGEAGR